MVYKAILQYLCDQHTKRTELSKKSQIPYWVVQSMMSGKRSIDLDEYHKICLALDVPVDAFDVSSKK